VREKAMLMMMMGGMATRTYIYNSTTKKEMMNGKAVVAKGVAKHESSDAKHKKAREKALGSMKIRPEEEECRRM
jgi:hypothetical protein